ncbi:MAG: hypothetical protein IPK67_17165 [Planctomycetes bacterium]|jgi:uncharacterized membrane protein|nr:hypothetical protein [Planctomycetota bacterium]
MGNVEFSQNAGMFWVVLTALFTLATTIYWMVVGWRAMRAHERIAETLERRLPE